MDASPGMASKANRQGLNVIIVGAGLAGLSAAISLAQKGNDVTVVETAPGLNELGAGIQMPPTSARILHAYGLTRQFEEKATLPSSWNFFRYDTAERLGSTALHPEMRKRYGYPCALPST